MRSPIHLTGDPDVDADRWAPRLAGSVDDAQAAAAALVGLGTPLSLRHLLDATRLPGWTARLVAVGAIRAHPLGATAAARLEELTRDPAEYVAARARETLEALRGPSEPAQPPELPARAPSAAVRLEQLLEEAQHVFECHADGRWRTAYKDWYARELLEALDADPGLERRLRASEDRLARMLLFRALELRAGR